MCCIVLRHVLRHCAQCVLHNRQSILDVSGQVPPEAIQDLLKACRTGMYDQVVQQVRDDVVWLLRWLSEYRVVEMEGTTDMLRGGDSSLSSTCVASAWQPCSCAPHCVTLHYCPCPVYCAAVAAATTTTTTKQTNCNTQITDMIAEGYPAQQVLLQLQAVVVPGVATGAAVAGGGDDTAAMSDVQRAKISELLAEADKNLVDGSDEFLQLLNVAGSTQAEIMAG